MKGSLGLIETRGWIPAVTAADTGLKAANVVLVDCTLTWPALITITFRGDVASVRAAVDSGSMAARAVGEVVSTHVIARPQHDFEQTTPAPFSGQEEPQATEHQEQTLGTPPVAAQKKSVKLPRKAAATKAAPAPGKKAPAQKAAKKTTTPKKAAAKKAPAQQKRQPAKPLQKKTGTVEAVAHDTHATDKKVAQEATAAVQGTTTSAAKTGGKTQKTLPPKKAAPRKRTIASSRKRTARKRPGSATKAAPKSTEQKQDATGVSPVKKDDTEPKE